jgi:hypothetical protein
MTALWLANRLLDLGLLKAAVAMVPKIELR